MDGRQIHISDLKTYHPSQLLAERDLGIGVITAYKLADDEYYFVMGEYHNKGALSPTVGLRYDERFGDVYAALKIAHARKRLGKFECDGSIDDIVFYATIDQPGFQQKDLARLTFINRVNFNLTLAQFKKNFIEPMHKEASALGCVAHFFWRLDETVKGGRAAFESNEERSQAAEVAFNAAKSLESHGFAKEIKKSLKLLKDAKEEWKEKENPLKFFDHCGGNNFSQITGFCIISLDELKQYINNPQITNTKKQTILIPDFLHDELEKKKKCFLFEDEVKTIVAAISHLSPNEKVNAEKQGLGFFKPCDENKLQALQSPWKVTSTNLNRLKVNLTEKATFDPDELVCSKAKGLTCN